MKTHGVAILCAVCFLSSAPVWAQNGTSADSQKAQMAALAAKPTPRTPDEHPDMSGVWGMDNFFVSKVGNQTLASIGDRRQRYDPKDPDQIQARLVGRDNLNRLNAPNQPPYKPELLDKVHNLEVNENQVDPAFACHPSGVPRMGPPQEIVQKPGLVIFLYSSENGAPYRIIHTDGRPHRTDVDPSYRGDSVGHWDGNTLVVDVTNFNDDTWLGEDGWFHSTKMHVVESFTRKGDTLLYQVTVEDPEVFTRPWVMNPRTIPLNTNPADEPVEEGPCVEEDRGHMVSHEHG